MLTNFSIYDHIECDFFPPQFSTPSLSFQYIRVGYNENPKVIHIIMHC